MMMNDDIIRLAHGSGSEATGRLIREKILPNLDRGLLSALGDSAVFEVPPGAKLAFTTDSYVVDPPFFPGGDIGYLAVCGTVNDLSVAGARPLYLSAGLIIEEGFPLESLERILQSMASAADRAGVQIVTGDTKVVPRGKADRIFINTAGVGVIEHKLELGLNMVRPGDAVIVNSPIGSHGIAVLLAREEFGLEFELESDVCPLNLQTAALLELGTDLRMMRDATRAGLAGVVLDIARDSCSEVRLTESSLVVKPAVRGACELLGYDPLYIANEGVLTAVVAGERAEKALELLKAAGAPAPVVIGRVVESRRPIATVETVAGGKRIVNPMPDELLPRIC